MAANLLHLVYELQLTGWEATVIEMVVFVYLSLARDE